MKFKIIVKKWAVFYFFIQNLSEWHFSCIKEYNEIWRKELGNFTSEEEKILADFRAVHQKYTFGEGYLGRYFFLAKNPLETIKQNLLKYDCNIILQTFSLFNKKFDIFYKNEHFLLNQWKLLLNKKLNCGIKNKKITEILNIVYNARNHKADFLNVYLLPSTQNTTSGSGYVGNNKGITAAISRQPFKNYDYSIAIIWHEAIHRCFEKQYFMSLVENIFPSDRDAVQLIKEVTTSSLFPNGLLGMKFLKKHGNLLNTRIPKNYNDQILKIVKPYIQKREPFNADYVNKLYSIVKDLKGIVK